MEKTTSSASKIFTRGLSFNVLASIIFLYFLCLSGDLLKISFGSAEVKIPRFLGGLLLCILLLSNRFRLIEKKLFCCFLAILSSFLFSSLFSSHLTRSLAACTASVFTYVCFFLVPLNLMHLFDRDKILRLYFISFAIVGLHAFSQFALSFFGVYDGFVSQWVGWTAVARGQSWAYEPSYYALFAVPFVVFLNTRFLLSLERQKWKVFGANVLLLSSTSTGGFFSYFIFIFVCLALFCFPFVREYFPTLRAKTIKFALGFFLVFASIGCVFMEIFLHTFYKFFSVGFLLHWSFADRWEKIVDAWEIFCAHPLFGCGLRAGEHLLYLKARFETHNVHLHGGFTEEMYETCTLTNVFMEVLACLGIYGLSMFVLLGIIVWQMFISVLKDARLPVDERKTLFCLFVSILVLLVCLQFNQELFRTYVWAHLGISLGYLLSVQREFLRA